MEFKTTVQTHRIMNVKSTNIFFMLTIIKGNNKRKHPFYIVYFNKYFNHNFLNIRFKFVKSTHFREVQLPYYSFLVSYNSL